MGMFSESKPNVSSKKFIQTEHFVPVVA